MDKRQFLFSLAMISSRPSMTQPIGYSLLQRVIDEFSCAEDSGGSGIASYCILTAVCLSVSRSKCRSAGSSSKPVSSSLSMRTDICARASDISSIVHKNHLVSFYFGKIEGYIIFT
ncbi:hypothetical protein [Aneurinibacillus sp. REN35]|uniref:hypothetical protein n=1 Tax=Aneurinibacillus sp. REN35 TaxID=3237286 RepID=UPI0035278E0C